MFSWWINYTDIQIDAGKPEKAFISAWNELVDNHDTYAPVWEDAAQNAADALFRYRAAYLINLVKETGRIESVDYRLVFGRSIT
jgi:hypothetical protein